MSVCILILCIIIIIIFLNKQEMSSSFSNKLPQFFTINTPEISPEKSCHLQIFIQDLFSSNVKQYCSSQHMIVPFVYRSQCSNFRTRLSPFYVFKCYLFISLKWKWDKSKLAYLKIFLFGLLGRRTLDTSHMYIWKIVSDKNKMENLVKLEHMCDPAKRS